VPNDNVGITPGSGAKAASREVSYSGEAAHVQVVGLATLAGADDDKSAADVSVDNPIPTQDAGGWWLLNRIYQMLSSPRGYDRSLQRQRGTVVVESGTVTTVTTVSTVTTCSTVAAVTNLAGFGGEQPQIMARAMSRASWRANVRACIS
jgi:hypothetical protein